MVPVQNCLIIYMNCCILENDCEKTANVSIGICFDRKQSFAIFLWERTEIDIRLPAIASFITVSEWWQW